MFISIICSNISLISPTRLISIRDLDTRLQPLIENKAYYLEIGQDRFNIFEVSALRSCFAEKKIEMNSEISGKKRPNTTLYAGKSMNPDDQEKQRTSPKARGGGQEKQQHGTW